MKNLCENPHNVWVVRYISMEIQNKVFFTVIYSLVEIYDVLPFLLKVTVQFIYHLCIQRDWNGLVEVIFPEVEGDFNYRHKIWKLIGVN